MGTHDAEKWGINPSYGGFYFFVERGFMKVAQKRGKKIVINQKIKMKDVP